MKKRVVIIGGGFAGLAASVELASSGHHVTIIEQRRYLGGRAYSFFDRNIGIELDNGQHIMMGCYENTFRFLKTIGAIDKLNIQNDLHVDFIDNTGQAYRLNCPPFPAPFHAALGVLGFNAVSLINRFRMMNVTRDVLFDNTIDPSDECTVNEWLNRLRQGKESYDIFWRALTLAIMNESPDIASASLFKNVLRKALFTDRKASRIVLPAAPLSRLYADNYEEYIKQHGGTIERGCPASELMIEDDTVTGIKLRDGRMLRGDYYIIAVPYYSLQRLLTEDIMSKYNTCFSGIRELKSSPILSVHLLFDKAITDYPFASLINSPVQWVFNKEIIYNDKAYRGLITIVISGAHNYITWNGDRLIDMALSELKRRFPEARSAKLLYARTIKERFATFSSRPGVQRYRPGQKTPIKNLFLAGDWTDTGLPATIEGAVLSGYRCAEMIIKSNI